MDEILLNVDTFWNIEPFVRNLYFVKKQIKNQIFRYYNINLFVGVCFYGHLVIPVLFYLDIWCLLFKLRKQCWTKLYKCDRKTNRQ